VQLLYWNFVHGFISLKEEFGRVMPFELSRFKGFYSFLDFFPQCVQLLHWNFIHGFISMTYRSSSKMVAINQFFGRVMPILRDFTVYMPLNFTAFGTFFPQCVQLLHLKFVQAFVSIRFKINLEEKLYHGISII
jgi:hypothetical protein